MNSDTTWTMVEDSSSSESSPRKTSSNVFASHWSYDSPIMNHETDSSLTSFSRKSWESISKKSENMKNGESSDSCTGDADGDSSTTDTEGDDSTLNLDLNLTRSQTKGDEPEKYERDSYTPGSSNRPNTRVNQIIGTDENDNDVFPYPFVYPFVGFHQYNLQALTSAEWNPFPNSIKISDGSLQCIDAINEQLKEDPCVYRKKTALANKKKSFMFWTSYDFEMIKFFVQIMPSLYPQVIKLGLEFAENLDPEYCNGKYAELEAVYNEAVGKSTKGTQSAPWGSEEAVDRSTDQQFRKAKEGKDVHGVHQEEKDLLTSAAADPKSELPHRHHQCQRQPSPLPPFSPSPPTPTIQIQSSPYAQVQIQQPMYIASPYASVPYIYPATSSCSSFGYFASSIPMMVHPQHQHILYPPTTATYQYQYQTSSCNHHHHGQGSPIAMAAVVPISSSTAARYNNRRPAPRQPRQTQTPINPTPRIPPLWQTNMASTARGRNYLTSRNSRTRSRTQQQILRQQPSRELTSSSSESINLSLSYLSANRQPTKRKKTRMKFSQDSFTSAGCRPARAKSNTVTVGDLIKEFIAAKEKDKKDDEESKVKVNKEVKEAEENIDAPKDGEFQETGTASLPLPPNLYSRVWVWIKMCFFSLVVVVLLILFNLCFYLITPLLE